MNFNEKIKKPELSTTQVIIMGFFVAIVIGAVLLCLPISAANGKATPFIDALFTATSSVCVTGLVVYNTYEHFSLFGQIVLLILIQFGGLGIVSFTTSIMVFIGKKVTLKDRLLLEDAFNLNTLSGLVKFLKRILKGTLIVESVGAICYMFVFIPEFGVIHGMWISIFNSVSAFCNAGMDIIGDSSLAPYVYNVWINAVTMTLIVLGGLGFIVWWDVLRVAGLVKNREIDIKDWFRKMKLHTKIVLTSTLFLIVLGTILVFMFEYTNEATIGDMSFGHKLLASLFQSVTLRTAGFLTISQKGLRDTTIIICIIFMFIGGSPVGTAGGIKTVTMATIIFTAWATVKGEEDVKVFKRTIPLVTIRKAMSIILISFITTSIAIVLLLTFTNADFIDGAFEVVSAIGTVGLTRDYTSKLNFIGKLIVICCMYLGRIGPISMVIAFNFKKGKKKMITFPKEDITVG